MVPSSRFVSREESVVRLNFARLRSLYTCIESGALSMLYLWWSGRCKRLFARRVHLHKASPDRESLCVPREARDVGRARERRRESLTMGDMDAESLSCPICSTRWHNYAVDRVGVLKARVFPIDHRAATVFLT
jgi:hypothetical protein